MASITFKGSSVNVKGNIPSIKDVAPNFNLVKSDLSELSLSELKGKTVVLNIFPSVDTGVCAASVRRFNKEAANLPNTVVICVSADLPFASGRFCAAEGLENVISASVFRNPEFAQDYGVLMTDGPLKGLLARAIVVIDPEGYISNTELVPEIVQEPNYEAVLSLIV